MGDRTTEAVLLTHHTQFGLWEVALNVHLRCPRRVGPGWCRCLHVKEHAVSLCFLVSVVIHVGDSGLEDVQVDLVLHRPQTRLETGDRHCLRGLQSGVNNRGFWQLRVVLVVDQDFLRLVKRDQYPQLPAAPQEIEKATLETVEESSFRGKVTPFSEVIPVAFLAGERMTTSASVHDSVVTMYVQRSFGHGSITSSFDPSPSESSDLLSMPWLKRL